MKFLLKWKVEFYERNNTSCIERAKKKIKYFTINENIKNSRILSLLLTIICIVTIF